MAWPTANDYFEAVQHPLRRFSKPELKRSLPAFGPDGKPQAHTGQRADVYQLRGAGGLETWAIGCFTQEPTGLARRYYLINEHLQQHPVPSFVETEYHEQGICIRGRWYPMTRSRWIDGVPLNAFVQANLDKPAALRALATAWLRLGLELRRAGIAHGNLCADTVWSWRGGQLGNPTLHLVDYDAVFVPALAAEASPSPPEEMGHADYQHPQRSWQKTYDAGVDRFAQLTIYTALQALAVGGQDLWNRFDNGHNLLFRAADFQEPGTSGVFQALWRSPEPAVRNLVGQLLLASQGNPGEVPQLEQLIDGGLNAAAEQHIEALLGANTGAFDVTVHDDGPAEDDFALIVDDEGPPAPRPPALPSPEAPPPLPAVVFDPRMRTYQFDAWMPEQIAVMKLHGFVKDSGGEIVSSEPGHICVHMLDGHDLVQPPGAGLLGWLGFVEQPPPAPRLVSVMDLYLVHKPTPTRTLIGVTLQIRPGSDAHAGPSWQPYCERAFCELRAFLIGTM